ncbi:SCO6745 family protein [Nocardiopsis ansamitocini]|uniref:SalK n=1 Tax=Nocardiopsis ansamitocini TaxID=1670832 RepID=A0A9W6P9Z7_9ACTN|nr:hypothetical protein [Nocardiopsis ansamitocini]GLU50380.1 hypothetical protein Nans01_47310 [Nocardiopsis ansamitocini]
MSTSAPTAAQARKAWAALEPVHTMIYFAPEASAAYEAIGLEPTVMGYFASRSAPLGAVGAGPVTSAFYNFNPVLVAEAVPRAWTLASPRTVIRTRVKAADTALRSMAEEKVLFSEGLAEAAELARTAALEAGRHSQGRTLFGAYAELEWPEEPHLVLWHAQTLLREFRGDGHLAALLLAGLDPVESLVTHAATGRANARALRVTRAWSTDEWAAATDRLAARGMVASAYDGSTVLTEAGLGQREEIEAHTDSLALAPYAALGSAGCERLITLAAPLVSAIVAAKILPGTRRR